MNSVLNQNYVTAGTYTFASFLPPVLLDGLLSLPHILVGIRDRLLPVPPAQVYPAPAPPPPASASESKTLPPTPTSSMVLHRSPRPLPTIPQATPPAEPQSDAEDGHETGSEADVESNEGDVESSGVGSSWVSLGPRESSD